VTLDASTLCFKKKLELLAVDPAYKERNLFLDYAGVPQLLRLEKQDSAPNRVAEFISKHY
jgi:hypothetical protein